MKTVNVQETIKSLHMRGIRYEEIATKLGKCYYTVWLLANGKREASLGDNLLLKQILDETNKELNIT